MPRLNKEPDWWSKARALSAQGLTPPIIAERLNKNPKTIRDVLNPESRARNKAKCKKQYASSKSERTIQ